MNCPKCKTVTLKSVVAYSNEAPRQCESCGGFWVQIEHIPKFLQQGDFGIQLSNPADVKAGLDSMAALCPNGHGILSRTRIEVEEGFYLDRCIRCGGIWFDQGEWQRLATAHLLDDIASFWTLPWQKKQREIAQENAYLRWAQEEFGDELFTKLRDVAKRLCGHPSRAAAIILIKNLSEKHARRK